MSGHVQAVCRETCNGCQLCHGGLYLCTRCGGAEGSLPTDCPGAWLTNDQQGAIYSGEVDYVGGRWTSRNDALLAAFDVAMGAVR